MKNNRLFTMFLLSLTSFCLFSCNIKRPSLDNNNEPETEENKPTRPDIETAIDYYDNKKFSLSGTWNAKSEADIFMYDLHNLKYSWTNKNEEEIQNFTNKYGKKFFLTFVGSECEVCSAFSEGFKYLENNANDFNLEGEFKLHSIIVDEKIEGDEKDHYKDESPYKYLFNNQIACFENIVSAGLQSYYAKNLVSITDYKNKLQSILTLDKTMDVPLVCLIDLTEKNLTDFVITQVFYSISGDDKISKADYLSDARMYKGNTFGKDN